MSPFIISIPSLVLWNLNLTAYVNIVMAICLLFSLLLALFYGWKLMLKIRESESLTNESSTDLGSIIALNRTRKKILYQVTYCFVTGITIVVLVVFQSSLEETAIGKSAFFFLVHLCEFLFCAFILLDIFWMKPSSSISPTTSTGTRRGVTERGRGRASRKVKEMRPRSTTTRSTEIRSEVAGSRVPA